MAHGLATSGYFLYNGEQFDLRGARVYCEKNWGGTFPRKWWWIQANLFEDEPDLTVTAVGAVRLIAGVYEETIGMIAVHYGGDMYEFCNCTFLRGIGATFGSYDGARSEVLTLRGGPGTTCGFAFAVICSCFLVVFLAGSSDGLSWTVSPWGSWRAHARSLNGYEVELSASTEGPGTLVLGPTRDGMVPNIRDDARGSLDIRLSAPDGTSILRDARSVSAQVEVGGGPWDGVWTARVPLLGQPLRGAINMEGRKVKTSI